MIKILRKILRKISKGIIKTYQPEVIAITGSVGKTSAKEAIFAVLSNKLSDTVAGRKKWRTRRAKGNLNNELGMPLTIIGNWKEADLKLVSRGQPAGTRRLAKLFFWLKVMLAGFFRIIFPRRKTYPHILVLEYGADRPGDIKYLLQIAKPKIGIVSAIGETPVHVEFYEGPEDVAREKSKLIEALPAGSYAILNFDDKYAMSMKEKTRADILTFGFSEGADVKISNFENISINGRPEGISFKIEYEKSFVPVNLKNAFGRAQAYSVAIAFAVGVVHGMNLVEIEELIERYYLPVKGRMNLVEGVKGSWVIDDSYNASPLSMKEALATLKDLEVERKIAVLGDMLELGKYSIEAHEDIGKLAADVADILVTVGPRGKFIAEKAVKSGMNNKNVFAFDSRDEAGKKIQEIIQQGDLVLVKASRGIGLDKVVDEIRAY